METRIYLTFILALGLLFFGCTDQSTPPETTHADGMDQVGEADNQAGDSSDEDGAADSPDTAADEQASDDSAHDTETEAPGDDQPGEETPSGDDGSDAEAYGTETCFELLSLGMPSKCTMTTNYQGDSQTVTFYMHGESKMRFEVPPVEGSPCHTVVIYDEGKTYVGCKDGKYLDTSCDWFMAGSYDTGDGQDSGTAEAGYFDSMKDMPRTECSCQVWVPDDSMFEVSGKICDQEQLMEDMMGNMQ
jgi:hypothetical protein